MPLQSWRIADLTLSVRWSRELSAPADGDLAWDHAFRASASSGVHTVVVRLGLPVQWQEPAAESWVFFSAGAWAAFQLKSGLGFISPAPGAGEWQRLLVSSFRGRQSELWLNPRLSGRPDTERRPYLDPFENLTLPFFTALFAQHQGMLVHAATVEMNGRAWVFAGPSGSGKSYWARQWHERGMAVLDEDRVVLRLLDGQVWAFGTPWHAEPRLCSPRGTPVERIFFLRQAESNTVQGIEPAGATTLLLRSSSLPIYDMQGTQSVLDVAAQAATQARSFLLGPAADNRFPERLLML
jgi:hypothetical protein